MNINDAKRIVFKFGTNILRNEQKDATIYKVLKDDEQLDKEEFLDFINIEELYTTQQEAVRNDMKRIMELPSSGVILIQNKKLFLYDFVIGAKH